MAAEQPQNDPPIERCEWIWENNMMTKRRIKFVPSLYEIYEKILVKAAEKNVTEISVSIDVENAIISVWNDGQRVDAHKNDEYWNKQAIRYSTEFSIETTDGSKRYKKVFTGSEPPAPPATTENCELESSGNWTKFSLKPSSEKFGMCWIEDDTVALMKRRVVDLAGCLGNNVMVKLDGAVFQFKTLEEYVELYLQEDNRRIYERVNDNWEICICVSDGEFDQVSFVNYFATLKGGSHVDYITRQVTVYMMKLVKLEQIELEGCLRVFVNAIITEPKFDSKTKDALITSEDNFPITSLLTFEFLNKTAETLLKKKAGKLIIEKLCDAKLADTVYASLCTLILTEGDSGKVLAMSGLDVLGKDKHGVFPLKGKLLNVMKANRKVLMNNEEIGSIKEILCLGDNEVNVKKLRYGRVLIMADQDHDGSHIKGLLIAAFHHLWPSLLSLDKFLWVVSTPICVAVHKKSENFVLFYSEATYLEWEKQVGRESTKYSTQSYKGLGGIDAKVGRKVFNEFYQQTKFFYRLNEEDDQVIEAAFGKNIQARKDWLQQTNQDTAMCDPTGNGYRLLHFFNKEIKHHAAENLRRSIPSMVDGFKPVNRKILFCARNATIEQEIIPLEALAGHVIGSTDYHHGSKSIAGVIIGMAQNFVGSNNINLLEPMGQCGTREMGGKDKAQEKYVSTRLSYITQFLYCKADEVLLKYLKGDIKHIEPEWYVPVIPMILVNGADGICFGCRSFVPKYDTSEIIANIKRLLRGEALETMHPSYRGFKGDIQKTQSKKAEYTVNGIVAPESESTLCISELPLNTLPAGYASYLEKVKGIHLEDYQELRRDNEMFRLHLSPAQMRNARNEGFLNKFKLTTTLNIGKMHLFDAEGKLKKYDTPEQILQEFFNLRLRYYDMRKTFLLCELKKGVLVLANKLEYGRQFLGGNIVPDSVLHNVYVGLYEKGFKSSTSIERAAEQLGWEEIEEVLLNIEEVLNVEKVVETRGYQYLLELNFGNFIGGELEKLEKEIDEMKRKINELTKATVEDLWRKDLDDLERELKNMAQPESN